MAAATAAAAEAAATASAGIRLPHRPHRARRGGGGRRGSRDLGHRHRALPVHDPRPRAADPARRRRADPRAAPLRRAHGAVAAPQAGAGSPRSRRSSPTSIVNTGDNLGHADGLRGLRAAFDPLRGIPGVFVHGSNDHAAPSPRNPLQYFTGPVDSQASTAEPLDTQALDGYLTDELGWLDLNNAVGSLDVARHARRRVRRQRRAPRLGPARRAARPARGAAGRRRSPPSRIGVTHAPYRRVLDSFTDLGADAIFAGHTHGGQVRRARASARSSPTATSRCARRAGLSTWTPPRPHGAAERQRGPRALDLRAGALRLPPRGIAAHARRPRPLSRVRSTLRASGRLGGLPRGVAQLGSARRSGRRGRRFKSCHPDSREAPPTRRSLSRERTGARMPHSPPRRLRPRRHPRAVQERDRSAHRRRCSIALAERVEVAIISGGQLAQFTAQVVDRLPDASPDVRSRASTCCPTCGTQYYRLTDGRRRHRSTRTR